MRSVQAWQRKHFYTEKLFSMDFQSVDAPHTHDLRAQIDQNGHWGNWGLDRIPRNFNWLLYAVGRISGAVVLAASLFTQRIPETAGRLTALNHPLFILLTAAVLLMANFAAPALQNQAQTYWIKYAEQARMGNRWSGFYGYLAFERHRALDVRIYRQEMICRHYMEKREGFTPKSWITQKARGPMGLLKALSAALENGVFLGLVYVFVCLKAWGGAFGVGAVTQYIGAVTALAGGLSTLLTTLGGMRANAAFLRTTFEFLDIPNAMYQGSLTVEKRSDRRYEVEFRDVSFKYPAAETWALRHVSFKFRVGERLAVVGENGSGKTTFIKLLCRLYDPTEGEILLNGIDIRKYDYAEYLSVFSVVFQDFRLLAFPLGENVAAAAQYDRERAEKCLDEAGFAERLAEMPAGLDTCLYKEFDDKGVEVSGGEAQKIAIARALYKDAPFIILDEPTAALDPKAEAEVYEKFNGIVGDKTAVYISHRLSSCRFCDKIAVFHEGQVVQTGSHDALAAAEGKYRELWNAQAQYYT